MKNKHVVFYSGGAGSYAAAKMVIEKHGPEAVTLLFSDTKIEDADLYRFLEDSSQKLGVEVTTIADGRDPWQVYHDARYLGGARGARCSIELKKNTATKWVKENCDPEATILYFGFDIFEAHRIVGVERTWEGWQVAAPLLDRIDLDKKAIMQMLTDDGIELPRLYKMGFAHNNCGGFCVKAGQGHFANLLLQKPEYYKECEDKEQAFFKHIGKVRPFMKRTTNGETDYISMKDLRESIEAGGQIDMFDVGGCGCFVEDVE